MTTIVTGAGLIGTALPKRHRARRKGRVHRSRTARGFPQAKLGDKGYALARYDVRDLPNLIATIHEHGADTVVHTAGLIGNRVQQSLYAGFDINLGGTRNIAEAVRISGVRRLVHISTFGVYDRRREEGNTSVAEEFGAAGRGTRRVQGGKGADRRGLCRRVQVRGDHAAAGQRVRAGHSSVGWWGA